MPREISIQTIDPLQKPAPMMETMKSGVESLLSQLRPEGEGRYSISDAQAPTTVQRQALQARSFILEASIRIRNPEIVRAKLAILVGMLPSPMTDSGDAEAAISIYQAVLADLPPWAVDEACTLALRGKVGATSGRFRPSPGEMHAAAERLVCAVALERRDIEKILRAEIAKPKLSEEARRAIVARVGRLTSDTVKACEAFPPRPVAPDHRDIPAQRQSEKAAATARLHDMAREAGNEWRE